MGSDDDLIIGAARKIFNVSFVKIWNEEEKNLMNLHLSRQCFVQIRSFYSSDVRNSTMISRLDNLNRMTERGRNRFRGM